MSTLLKLHHVRKAALKSTGREESKYSFLPDDFETPSPFTFGGLLFKVITVDEAQFNHNPQRIFVFCAKCESWIGASQFARHLRERIEDHEFLSSIYHPEP